MTLTIEKITKLEELARKASRGEGPWEFVLTDYVGEGGKRFTECYVLTGKDERIDLGELTFNEENDGRYIAALDPEMVLELCEAARERAELKKKMGLPQAMEVLIKAMREDFEYAWAWHCNIAMASVDEGLDRYRANKAADRFMQICFNISTGTIFKDRMPDAPEGK